MVEQEAVNFEVVGSSPTPGANYQKITEAQYLCFLFGASSIYTQACK